jgi:hypothetical protein
MREFKVITATLNIVSTSFDEAVETASLYNGSIILSIRDNRISSIWKVELDPVTGWQPVKIHDFQI